MANNLPLKTIADVWQKTTNPLRTLNTFEIERMLQNARLGNDVKLQQCFSLIEQNMPIFSVCIDKRASGIVNRKWDIVAVDDSAESKAQTAEVKKIFEKSDTQSEDNLTDAITHLCLAAFRGRAFVKPFIDGDHLVFKKIENWNILRKFNKLWWNPEIEFPLVGTSEEEWRKTYTELPKDEVCYSTYERPVDFPGITIYLRQLVGESKWAQFVERCGIPQVIVTAPEGTPDSNLPLWTQRAVQVMNGGSGVMPSGAQITELTSGRAQDPFSSYCQHQMEMIAILATGGAINTLGGSTGMNSNISDKQNEQFQSLISQDCKKISNTLTNVAVKKAVNQILKQDKVLCRFDFVESDQTKPEEYLAMATQLQQLGATIDLQKLRDLTKLQFIKLEGNAEDEIWTPNKEN